MPLIPAPPDQRLPTDGRIRVALGLLRDAVRASNSHPEPGTPGTISKLIRAIAFAERALRASSRRNREGTYCLAHPLAVADLLATQGSVSDIDVLCAALLHGLVEDTSTTLAEIAREFGADVAAIVAEVVDDPPTWKKPGHIEASPVAKSEPAKLIKLAGTIASLRSILNDPPLGLTVSERRALAEHAANVVAGQRGVSFALEEAFDSDHRERVYADPQRLVAGSLR